MANTFLPKASSWSQNHQIPEQLERFCSHLKKTYPQADWTVTLVEQESFGLEVREQKTEHFEQTQNQQLDIEIVLPHRSASASVLGFQWADWVRTAEQACNMARRAQEDRWLKFPEQKYFDLSLKPFDDLAQPQDILPTTLQEHLLRFEQMALDLAPGIVRSDGASLEMSYQRHSYCNSAGLQLLTPATSIGQYLSLIAQDHASQESDYIGDSARNWDKLRSLEELSAKAVQRVVPKLGKKKIPSGNYPVIFSQRCAMKLISCLLQAVSGRLQYLKSTFLLDALGQTLFPSWVNLTDEPRAHGRSNRAIIDRDGLPTKPHHLIADGKLNEYLLSYYSACRLGLEPNGLASGLINMSLSHNAADLAALAAQYPECVIVHSLSGTGINLMHGDYSQGIEGFYFRNGVCEHALEETTVASSLRELFLSLEGHAADWDREEGQHIGSLAFPKMAVSCQ